MDTIYQILIPFATAAIAWLFGKLKTKREKTQSDLQTVESTISPLLVSIKELNEHNKMLMSELLAERKESIAKQETISSQNETISQMKIERKEFLGKIERLEKKVEKLTTAINNLRKNETDSSSSF